MPPHFDPNQPELPAAALDEQFITASGPGGQNVNKVATAVQLRIDCYQLGLAPYAFARLRQIAGSRMTAAGLLLIHAQRFRSQEANRTDARARAIEMLLEAHKRDARRIKTRPGKGAKARRVDEKKARGSIKQGRGKITLE